MQGYLALQMQIPNWVSKRGHCFLGAHYKQGFFYEFICYIFCVFAFKRILPLHVAPKHGSMVVENFFLIKLKYDLSENEYGNVSFSKVQAKCSWY